MKREEDGWKSDEIKSWMTGRIFEENNTAACVHLIYIFCIYPVISRKVQDLKQLIAHLKKVLLSTFVPYVHCIVPLRNRHSST